MATIAERFDAVLNALTEPVVLTAQQRQTVYESYFAQAADAQLKQVLGVANLTLLANGDVDRSAVTVGQKKGMFLWRKRYETKMVVLQVQREAEVAAAEAATAANLAAAEAGSGLS